MNRANRLTATLRECEQMAKELPFPNRASRAGLTYHDGERIKQCAYLGAGTFQATMIMDWHEASNAPPALEYGRVWIPERMHIYRGGIVTESGMDVMREVWLKPSNVFDAPPFPSMQNICRAEEIDLCITDRALLRRLICAGAGGIACLMLVKWLSGTNQMTFRQFGQRWIKDWTGPTWGLHAMERVWLGLFPGGLHA